MRRFALELLLLGLLVAACSPAIPPAPEGTSPPLETVRLPMGYIPDVQFAPFYVAVEKGFFAEEGLHINFDYSFETDGVTLVGSNELPFAVVSAEQVLLARAQELPVVYVAAWYRTNPVVVVARQEQAIRTPQDLVGKQIGLPGLFGANYIGFRALLDQAGLKEDQMTLNSIGYNQVQSLAVGQQDAVVVYSNNEPVQLRAQGFALDEIAVSDVFDMPSNGLIASETVIRDNPELVRRLVRAMLRGVKYAATYPDEAFEISKKHVENLAQSDVEIQRAILDASIALWGVDSPGYSDPQLWDNLQTVLLSMGLLTQPLDLGAAFTNDFIPRQ